METHWTGGRRRGVRDGRTGVQRSPPRARRCWHGRPRGRVLRSARIRARQADSWRLRCIRWRTAPDTATEAVTWRALARSGMLLGAGIAYMIVSAGAANAPRPNWFGGAVAASGTVLVLLSMRTPVRRPSAAGRCGARRAPRSACWPAMRCSRRWRPRPGLRGPSPGAPPGRMHRRILVYGSDRPGQPGSRIPGPSGGARRPACRTCITAGRPDTGNELASPDRHRSRCPD